MTCEQCGQDFDPISTRWLCPHCKFKANCCDGAALPDVKPPICARCERPMVPKGQQPPEGWVASRARGLCGPCYATLWKQDRAHLDHGAIRMTREETAEEWRVLADLHRTHRENAELIAPRLGTTVPALERTMRRVRQDRRLAS